jgi:hypothetical protein
MSCVVSSCERSLRARRRDTLALCDVWRLVLVAHEGLALVVLVLRSAAVSVVGEGHRDRQRARQYRVGRASATSPAAID